MRPDANGSQPTCVATAPSATLGAGPSTARARPRGVWFVAERIDARPDRLLPLRLLPCRLLEINTTQMWEMMPSALESRWAASSGAEGWRAVGVKAELKMAAQDWGGSVFHVVLVT